MYRLEYLPAARQDMVELVSYINKDLGNPSAADRLAAQLIEAADRVAAFPYMAPAYVPLRPLRREYRKLTVEHYCIFYWVEEEKKLVSIARVLYGKRLCTQMLERPDGRTGG